MSRYVAVGGVAQGIAVGANPATPVTRLIPQQGFSVDAKFINYTSTDQSFVISKMVDLSNGHLSWVRIDWFPSTPQSDASIATVEAAGFRAMGLWNRDPSSGISQSAFAAAAATLAGEVDLLNVWNEPDMSGWTASTAANYALAAYTAIKAVNPTCIVVGPSLWKTPSQDPADGYTYAVNMLSAVSGQRFADIWDEHLYDDEAQVDPSFNKWDWVFRNGGTNIRNLLDSYPNWAGTPIMCTEAGTNVTVNGTTYQNSCVVDGMAARDTLGLESFGVYTILNTTQVSAPGFGLLDSSNVPRPAYASFKAGAR